MRDIPAMAHRIDQEFGQFYAQLESPEAREAFTAFFEKRPADFSKL
jgi:enoyl-CoA hydratase/carnithine racemase